MKVNIFRAENLDNEIFDRLKNVLDPFSKPLEFIFKKGTFQEPTYHWDRNELKHKINQYRQANGIQDNEFVIFITRVRDENNWFSACLNDWNKNIFISSVEWIEDNIFEIDKVEYPLAYQIIENLFQYLISDNYNDYINVGHEKPRGCINDFCEIKTDIIFKLRTADICKDCQKLAERKIEENVYEQIIEILENIRFQFLHNKRNFTIFQKSINKVKIEYLREIKKFISDNLNSNEKTIQDWLDEDNGKYRERRSLIFGLDYRDPKREGEIKMRKRFDILAEQNLENHIIIELKSPKAKIFKIETIKNRNGGESTTYSISDELARAIPQILHYKRGYEEMDEERMRSLGLSEKKSISECIIVIGQRKDDAVWKKHFEDLKKNLNIKILTYNDLIDKLDNTIKNLEVIMNK